ncbi:MAG: (2Fe-2S)-binding protein, partial [Bacteroidia bacterium]|nr:(2Fe-2S)-binding protein [Bacteroidia bacterium]
LQGMKIKTIEGITKEGLHPVQEARIEIYVPQSGYSQTAQIKTATSFLKNNPKPTDSEIRNAMQTNICRCAAYNSIEKAVKVAAKKLS